MTNKQLVGIRLPADMLVRIRGDAALKGQALNVWFTRAAVAALGGAAAVVSPPKPKRRAKA